MCKALVPSSSLRGADRKVLEDSRAGAEVREEERFEDDCCLQAVRLGTAAKKHSSPVLVWISAFPPPKLREWIRVVWSLSGCVQWLQQQQDLNHSKSSAHLSHSHSLIRAHGNTPAHTHTHECTHMHTPHREDILSASWDSPFLQRSHPISSQSCSWPHPALNYWGSGSLILGLPELRLLVALSVLSVSLASVF